MNDFDAQGAYVGPDWGALARAARASNANGVPESLVNPGGFAAEGFDTVLDALKMAAAAKGKTSTVAAGPRMGPSQGFNAMLLRQQDQPAPWSQGQAGPRAYWKK